jgi:hypothetical protein
MANTIGTNYANLFKSLGTTDKNSAVGGKNSAVKSSSAQTDKNYSVELSESGLNALANRNVDDVTDTSAFQASPEEKLSAKAQAFLDKLREKYDDYDFVIADDVDKPQDFSKTSNKSYSVILSSEEIEKMAEDEEFADKVMGHVDKAVGALNEVSQTALGEGVQFSSLSAEVDEEGNMKLFASLENMSTEQRERLEKLQEKRAEENQKSAEDEETEEVEPETFSYKTADVEATSTSELLEKIFGIKWDEIAEETFTF